MVAVAALQGQCAAARDFIGARFEVDLGGDQGDVGLGREFTEAQQEHGIKQGDGEGTRIGRHGVELDPVFDFIEPIGRGRGNPGDPRETAEAIGQVSQGAVHFVGCCQDQIVQLPDEHIARAVGGGDQGQFGHFSDQRCR